MKEKKKNKLIDESEFILVCLEMELFFRDNNQQFEIKEPKSIFGFLLISHL